RDYLVTGVQTCALPIFQSFIVLFPAEWRGPMMVLAAPLRWIPVWQNIVLTSMSGQHPATVALAAATLLMPVLLMIAGMWSTMVSIGRASWRAGGLDLSA